MTHCPFLYVYVCVHMYAGWYSCMCVPVWRSKTNLGCRVSVVNHIGFDAVSASSPLSYAGLAKVPGIHLSLPPQPWFFECTPLKLLLCGGSSAGCQGGCIGRQTLSRWSCLSTLTLPLLPKHSWLGVPAIGLHLQILW